MFPLIVATAETCPALSPHGVYFVDEYYAGLVLPGLFEHVSNPGGTHAHEHFNEIRTTDAEKGNIGLARTGPCQKGFAGAGRSQQEHPLRYLGAQPGKPGGVPEVIHDFLQFLLRFITTGHIGEGNLGPVIKEEFRLVLGETHNLVAPALHMIEDENPGSYQEQGGKEGGHHGDPPR